ncbi:MAG: adenylate/guanylate cyclase domain-containing protein [Betaproteobacteria bacterium]
MRRLRLATGLIVAAFVVTHFLNHALGVVSVDAMDRMRDTLATWWRSWPGSVLLYGSLLTHFALALAALYRRTTLRMPPWEAAQIVLGLAVLPLLIGHIVGTRLTWMLLDEPVGYERIITLLWSSDLGAPRQALLLLIVWGHLCFGVHYWLRVKAWYPAWQPLAFALAILVPTLALTGFASAGYSIGLAPPPIGQLSDEQRARAASWRNGLELAFWSLLALTLLARFLRSRIGGTYQLRLSSGRVITAPIGRSILEALRDEGVPHASVCGGRARCTTCRVRVGEGLAALPAASAIETQALSRIDAPANVRLACQARPRRDVSVTPLLPAGAGVGEARQPGRGSSRERPIVAVFVDLRDSTKLAEGRLPYDTVFIMNQFFAEMYEALRASNGYYAQFRGDGLLALYGLQSDLATACRESLAGAAEMARRMEKLNRELTADLPAPLRIGIGIHCGLAIVGTMGPPEAPIHSAIGDNINIAARLEGMTKSYGCTLVVSAETLAHAGADPGDATLHHVRVRGRDQRLDVYAVADPRVLFAEPAVQRTK